MITLQNVTLRRGPNILFQNVNWTIFHKQRIGIIGANGTGKSSLFALLREELQMDQGDILRPKQLKLAHVAQETPALSISALDFVLEGDTEYQSIQNQLEEAYVNNDAEKIANLHESMSIIDGYTAKARAAQLLDGLSFAPEEIYKPVSAFSGGWRMRLNLAHALMCRSDILLLDEPTNHLDLDAVIWLQDWLKHYAGTLLLISHDRDFLDEVVDHIAHVHNQQITLYGGNYSIFEKVRAEKLALQQAAYEKQQKKVAHLQSFITRFKAKASKAKQAQSRMKALERMEVLSAVQAESPLQFEFFSPASCPNPLLNLDDAKIAYDAHVVLNDLSYTIGPKDRIALLGPNGAGKSSFIKLLAGELSPKTGIRECSSGIKIGYFAQHQVDHLYLDESPLFHLKKLSPNTREQELRTYLGSFDFVGEQALSPIRHFSGGEKSRLALALLIWQKPNLLLLDEPTNHLDLEMRQALTLALQDYEGAMILVSHDRFLLRATVDQFILVADGKATPFTGDLSDYEIWLQQYRKQRNISTEPSVKTPQPKPKNTTKNLISHINKLETKIAELEKLLTEIEVELNDTALYQSDKKSVLQEKLAQQEQLKSELKTAEETWLKACEERDTNL